MYYLVQLGHFCHLSCFYSNSKAGHLISRGGFCSLCPFWFLHGRWKSSTPIDNFSTVTVGGIAPTYSIKPNCVNCLIYTGIYGFGEIVINLSRPLVWFLCPQLGSFSMFIAIHMLGSSFSVLVKYCYYGYWFGFSVKTTARLVEKMTYYTFTVYVWSCFNRVVFYSKFNQSSSLYQGVTVVYFYSYRLVNFYIIYMI